MKAALDNHITSNACRLITRSTINPSVPEPGLVTMCSGERLPVRAEKLLSQQKGIAAL